MSICGYKAAMITDVPLFRFKRGGHVCVFYHDETTLLEFLVSYVREGLRDGEKCFLVQSPSIVRRLPSALNNAGICFKEEVEQNAIELYCTDDVYLKLGSFDVHAMMRQLEVAIAGAVEKGFQGLRTAGDLGWASAINLPHETLTLYEKLVQDTFPHRMAIGVCQYPIHMFSKELLERVLENHQASLQQPQVDSSHSCLSIRDRAFTLDVVADRQEPQNTVYYVVQKLGSTDIVGFGAEATVGSAIRMGKQLIRAS